MFEAHYLAAEDYEELGSSAPCWKKTYQRHHIESNRPLTIWFAEGNRVSREGHAEKLSFVYVEYKDDRGANRYRCIEINLAGQSLSDVLDEAVRVELKL